MYMKEELIFSSGGRSNYRIPSIVVDRHGTVYAFCNDRKDGLEDHADEVALVFARKKLGGEWEDVRELVAVPGWACSMGSAVYDEECDVVMCSGRRIPKQKNEFKAYTQEEIAQMNTLAEKRAQELGIRQGQFFICSADGGESWQDRPMEVETAEHVQWDGTIARIGGDCHGAGAGIQLRSGQYKGRLLCPSRTQVGTYSDWEGLRKCVYNNAIYSDDHGMTWKASRPVQLATGEGTLIEDGEGNILYNSRAYYQDQKRYLAISRDGGVTYGDFGTDPFLIEEKNIGCNASFLRVAREDIKDTALLPSGAGGITLFANPRSAVREKMTVCISFDDGRTWSGTKSVYEGPCAYSSLAFSRADQWFYLLYEKGESSPYEKGIAAAVLIWNGF